MSLSVFNLATSGFLLKDSVLKLASKYFLLYDLNLEPPSKDSVKILSPSLPVILTGAPFFL